MDLNQLTFEIILNTNYSTLSSPLNVIILVFLDNFKHIKIKIKKSDIIAKEINKCMHQKWICKRS